MKHYKETQATRQPIDLDDVLNSACYGGDIDAVYCKQNVCVFIDVKVRGKAQSPSQSRMYHDLVNAWVAYGGRACALTVWHEKPDAETIKLADCVVHDCYDRYSYHVLEDKPKAGEFIRDFFESNGVTV